MSENPRALKYKKAHRRVGLCINCSEKAVVRPDGKTLTRCETHRLNVNEQTLEQKRRRLAEGRCVSCGNLKNPDIDNEAKRCMNCRQGLYTWRPIAVN